MNNYQLILECIRSGQLSAAQINAHMQDEVFAAWHKKQTEVLFTAPIAAHLLTD